MHLNCFRVGSIGSLGSYSPLPLRLLRISLLSLDNISVPSQVVQGRAIRQGSGLIGKAFLPASATTAAIKRIRQHLRHNTHLHTHTQGVPRSNPELDWTGLGRQRVIQGVATWPTIHTCTHTETDTHVCACVCVCVCAQGRFKTRAFFFYFPHRFL